MASPDTHGEAIGLEARADLLYLGIVLGDFEMTLEFLHGDGWSYGLIRFLNTVTGEEVCQIDAHKGDRRERGTGSGRRLSCSPRINGV